VRSSQSAVFMRFKCFDDRRIDDQAFSQPRVMAAGAPLHAAPVSWTLRLMEAMLGPAEQSAQEDPISNRRQMRLAPAAFDGVLSNGTKNALSDPETIRIGGRAINCKNRIK
jgi:hypothetical protein